MLGALLAMVVSAAPLQVGVTLQPYYSWAARVTEGLPISVVLVVPDDVDAGNYQPRPADVAKLAGLDVLLINGLGHDDFILGMLEASGNTHCQVVRLNAATALLPARRGEAMNSHTFLSFSNAIQQSYLVARALGERRPELKVALEDRASAYAARLRALRASALERLASVPSRRVVTVHDGYGYLLRELRLELVDVVEPAHGLVPSAAELQRVLARLDAEPRKVVLAEERFPSALLEVLKERGARVVQVSHVAVGPASAAHFEDEMAKNVDALVEGLGG